MAFKSVKYVLGLIWENDSCLLLMGGGRSLEYCRKWIRKIITYGKGQNPGNAIGYKIKMNKDREYERNGVTVNNWKCVQQVKTELNSSRL